MSFIPTPLILRGYVDWVFFYSVILSQPYRHTYASYGAYLGKSWGVSPKSNIAVCFRISIIWNTEDYV